MCLCFDNFRFRNIFDHVLSDGMISQVMQEVVCFYCNLKPSFFVLVGSCVKGYTRYDSGTVRRIGSQVILFRLGQIVE